MLRNAGSNLYHTMNHNSKKTQYSSRKKNKPEIKNKMRNDNGQTNKQQIIEILSKCILVCLPFHHAVILMLLFHYTRF